MKLGIPVRRMNEIVNGKSGITPETAWLFAGALGASPEFWMNLQSQYDLARTRPAKKVPRLGQRDNQLGWSKRSIGFGPLSPPGRGFNGAVVR